MGKRKGNLEGFADRLRDEMYDKNITQVELSERIGMERKSIGKYVNGESTPNCLFLARICKYLDVSADYLLFGGMK